MNQYNARDLMALTKDELWALPEEHHTVVFDDGVVTTHTRATITSAYFWGLLKDYPEVPVTRNFHMQDATFSSGLMLDILNRILWTVYDHYAGAVHSEVLAQKVFNVNNEFYNDFTTRISEYVAGMSMFDILEVMYHPDIKAANDKVDASQHSIENECYPAIKNALLNAPSLRQSALAKACRSGTVKMGQVLQSVGPRGFLTDINSDIFPEPIMTGYIEGINGLYETTIESRSGSKSLLYNKELLRTTEYFNRKTQLIAEYVQQLHAGDCGTPHLVDMPILRELLPYYEGKYYMNEGKLTAMRGDEEHLIGTVVKMRSVLGCVHPDPTGLCEVCYGELGKSIPLGTNLGQVSAVSMGDKITSSVLSTKHSEATSTVEKFKLNKTEGRFLKYGEKPENLYLKPEYQTKKLKLVVARQEVANLADVLMLSDLDNYPVANASQITMMQIIVDYGDEGKSYDVLRVSLYNRKSSFSRELLKHIASKRWTHDERENVVIDLDGFDVKQPLLSLPFKHVSMHEVMKRIQSFLHSSSDTENKKLKVNAKDVTTSKLKFLKSYKDPVEALVTFTAMLNEKLNVNIVHCEVLVYAMMIRSAAQKDYRLPKPGIHGSFETYNRLMTSRSLSAAMAYEKQSRPLVIAGSFIYRERNDHPYDYILMGGQGI